MEAITCYCLECKHKLGRFRNSWDMIGTNYYSPIYPALTHENGFTGSGEVRMADFGSIEMECYLQDVACKKCNKFLGIRCDSAPEGHNLWTNQVLLRLSNTTCLVDGTGLPANISVVNRLPLLPLQPSKESGKKPKGRASTAQPSSSGRKKASSVQPRSVRGQSQSSAGLMLPPPLPPAKKPAQKQEEFQDWAERVIKSQQRDIDRLSGAVERIEGTVEAMRKLLEDLRGNAKEFSAKASPSNGPVGIASGGSPSRQNAFLESLNYSKNPYAVSKRVQKRKRANSEDPQELASAQEPPKSKRRRIPDNSMSGTSTTNGERSTTEMPSSGQRHSAIIGQDSGHDLPIQASNGIRASCPPIWNTKPSDSGSNRAQIEQYVLQPRESRSPVNSFSSPIPLYDQDLVITGKRNRGREIHYGKERDSEGNLIRPSGKVDGRSLRGKKSSIGQGQDAETRVASTHSPGPTREGELNVETKSQGTLRNAEKRPDQVYPTVENQTPVQQESSLSWEKMTPVRRSMSPDELSSDAVYNSPRIRVIQRFTAPPSILREQFTPTVQGAKEAVQIPMLPLFERESTTPMATIHAKTPVSDPPIPNAEAQTAGLPTESETKPFCCGVCKKRYGSLRGLKYHKEHVVGCNESTNDEFPDVKCATCQKSYCNIYSLSRHICKVIPTSSDDIVSGSLGQPIANPATERSQSPRGDQSLRRSIVSSVGQSGVGNGIGNVKATANATPAAKEKDIEEARKVTMAAREQLVRETMERELGTTLEGGGGFTIEI